jgi:hypothetical protein
MVRAMADLSRVRSRVDFSQLRNRHVGIDLGRRKISVPEQSLDVANVRAVVEHVRCAGVTKEMAGPPRWEPGIHDVPPHRITETVLCEGLAVVGKEQRVAGEVSYQAMPNVAEISSDPKRCPPCERCHAIAPALPTSDEDRSGFQAHIAQRQSRELHSP